MNDEERLLNNFRVIGMEEAAERRKRSKAARRAAKNKVERERRRVAQEEEEERRCQVEQERQRQEEEMQQRVEEATRQADQERHAERQRKQRRAQLRRPRSRSESPRRQTRNQGAKTRPRHSWALIELLPFADFISSLGCPQCGQVAVLRCEDWRETNGGFSVAIRCEGRRCQFDRRFRSTTPIPGLNRQDAPTRLVIALGTFGVGFEKMQSVWAFAGGVLPICSKGYRKVMKQLVRPNTSALSLGSTAFIYLFLLWSGRLLPPLPG